MWTNIFSVTHIVEYLNLNGFEKFTANNINAIVEGKKLRKYPELAGKIFRIELSEDELKEIREAWRNI